MIEEKYTTNSPAETEKLGEELTGRLARVSVLAMRGGLGAGKTTITRGIAKGFGVTDGVKSPTYAIVNEYRGDRIIYHFDMYRINTADELFEIGWEDYIASGGLCIVEWSENVADALPDNYAEIIINHLGENMREVIFRLC